MDPHYKWSFYEPKGSLTQQHKVQSSIHLLCKSSVLRKIYHISTTFLQKTMRKSLPLFVEIVLSKWSQNPYVRGSWSDPVVGTDYTVHANMAGRIKNLFFGGEATHGDWYGFMQGAYYSGLERANEIASCIQRKKCEAYQPSTGLPVIAIPCPINASSYKRLSLSVMAAALIFFGSF